MKSTAFDSLHPSIALAYFGAALVLAMAAPHPTLLAISFACAITCGIWLRGGTAVAKSFAWQLPLLLIIMAINPLFSSTGTTELFRIGTQAVYAEGYENAATMALLFLCVMQWFSNANVVLSTNKVMGALGGVLPTISLMISMIMRLVPRFVRRGRAINTALAACTAAHKPRQAAAFTAQKSCTTEGRADAKGASSSAINESEAAICADPAPEHEGISPMKPKRLTRAYFSEQLRIATTLMGWSMEDSLESADSMRCRGWGSTHKRTTFRRMRFHAFDAIALTILAFLFAGASYAAYALMEGFGFFPALHGNLASPLATLYALALGFPLLLELAGKVRR